MSKQVSYTSRVWQSKNGNWRILDKVEEIVPGKQYKTTMYIEQQTYGGYQDWPIMYQDGTFGFDFPERIPEYVKSVYKRKMIARREQWESLQREIAVVGYFNWCDTYCSECVASKHIDVSTYTELTHKQAVEDMGYTCDMCGMAFPKDVVLELLQVN